MENDEIKKLIELHKRELEETRAWAREARQQADEAWARAEQLKAERDAYKGLRLEDVAASVASFGEYLNEVRINVAERSAYLRLPWWKKLFVAEPEWK